MFQSVNEITLTKIIPTNTRDYGRESAEDQHIVVNKVQPK